MKYEGYDKIVNYNGAMGEQLFLPREMLWAYLWVFCKYLQNNSINTSLVEDGDPSCASNLKFNPKRKEDLKTVSFTTNPEK